ncbi:MAG: o-succinylbenzoate synthase [Ferrimicrobium sp.]
MRIERVCLNFIELPLVAPFSTSHGRETTKSTFIVSVYDGDGRIGYAETGAGYTPGYTAETHASVYYMLRDHLIPLVLDRFFDHPSAIADALSGVRGNRMAKASLEMACWDLAAKEREIPLWRLLGGETGRELVSVGVSVGMQDTPDELVRVVERYVDAGYRRVKIKIEPNRDLEWISAVRSEFDSGVSLSVDGNGSYKREDCDQLRALDELGLSMIEQPFDSDDLVAHSDLARSLQTPLCLDESIVSRASLACAIELGAIAICNIKTARVGGYREALAVYELAREHGLGIWCGGLLETGVGRAHNLHLASLSGFNLPGDISATDRYFAHDIVTEPFVLGPDSTIRRPSGPGIGRDVDFELVARCSRFREEFRGDDSACLSIFPHDH